ISIFASLLQMDHIFATSHFRNLSPWLEVDEQVRIAELLDGNTEVVASGTSELVQFNCSKWETIASG
ncbi:hypothetical protein PMAYCL1PPCAC_09969, partial [Pristionchus mayeri]